MSYTGQQNINAFLQAIGEKLYPKTLDFKDFALDLYDITSGSATFQPLTLKNTSGSYTGGGVQTKDLYDFSHISTLKVTVNSGTSSSGSDMTIRLFDANNTKVAEFTWNLATGGYSKEFDLSTYNGQYKFYVSFANGGGATCQFSRLIAE